MEILDAVRIMNNASSLGGEVYSNNAVRITNSPVSLGGEICQRKNHFTRSRIML